MGGTNDRRGEPQHQDQPWFPPTLALPHEGGGNLSRTISSRLVIALPPRTRDRYVSAMAFSAEELERYRRHILLKEVGGAGQQKLKAASVVMIGAGGLGAPAALYLAAAGVGRLRIIDPDQASLSNLQRQIIYRSEDVGRAKVERTAEALAALNPNVTVEPVAERLDETNAQNLLAGFDLILGPDRLRSEMGLVAGDFRRDYRHLSRAAEQAAGPLALGCFGELDTLRALLNKPAPGAWAAAVAARDVVLSPAVPAVALPLGLDVGRAAVVAVRELAERMGAGAWLTREGPLGPTLSRVREMASTPKDLRQMLGFDPIALLARLVSRGGDE